MPFELISINTSISTKQALAEIEECSEYIAEFGLTLTRNDKEELVQTRAISLRSCGRIEFAGGVMEKIIKGFCDSSYISRHNFAETLNELVELFYSYKNEALDIISDDELIEFMKERYDGKCQGSLELLGRELDKMARDLRYGITLEQAAGEGATGDLYDGSEELENDGY